MRRLLAGIALASAPLWSHLSAQDAGKGFTFKQPWVGLSLRGGYATADANSDVFQFATKNLTLSKRNFRGLSVEADMSVAVSPRMDVVLTAGYTGSNTHSEFRDWVDTDQRPIEQTTRFERVPMSVDLRYYLTGRGRRIGSFAWIPAKYAMYAGGGVGASWYRFRQTGDFVDFQTYEVFPNRYNSNSLAPLANAFTGMEYSLSPRMALSSQVKYVYAHAEMGSDWLFFDPIDLSGLAFSAGVHFRF